VWLELESPAVAADSRPGQFVMLGYGLDSPGQFMLPRPFSVGWRSGDGRIGILLRIFGGGTHRLSTLRPGDSLLVLGPLGVPFRLDERPVQCIAGGVGLAPFIFLSDQATAAGRSVRLIYGERSGSHVFDPELVKRLTGMEPEVWTEDGSLGRQGLVTRGMDLEDDSILLACGPTPMLQAVRSLAHKHGKPLQVSVEEYMGCGVGTCQGCVVPGSDGRWIKSCLEGPVFDAEDLAWPT
jgi:dihydroorotate dehydrogenase electron transfer subunit